MMGHLRQGSAIRLLPILVIALAALGTVKVAGLVLVGGYALAPVAPAVAQEAPGRLRQNKVMTTNSPDGAAEEGEFRLDPGESDLPRRRVTDAERSLLESLRQRREELDKLERGLAMREQLLKAAEKRIDEKIEELKAIEQRVAERFRARDAENEEQFAGLVKMYEAMKPKKAARIFNRLDTAVLVGVARRMKPAALADIIAVMDPTVAENVTIQLANGALDTSMSPIEELAPVSLQ